MTDKDMRPVLRGVVRDTSDPSGRTMYVLFDRAVSDDEMRDWHDSISNAALDAAEGRAVVKPLVFSHGHSFGGQDHSHAESPFGPWTLTAYSGRFGNWAYTDSSGEDSEDDWAERDDCEAAAQAEYKARILSAIIGTATPAPSDKIAEAARLYLDLDGVMADFDAHYPAEFGQDHRSMADDDMWAKINAHPSYFEDMPLCPGAADFFAEIRHLKPIILTACPRTNYAHVAGQKRRWVHKHLGAELTVLPVMGGHNKHLFMHAPGDILIDDYEKNCAPWRKSGGVAILHTSFDATRAALRALAGQGETP